MKISRFNRSHGNQTTNSSKCSFITIFLSMLVISFFIPVFFLLGFSKHNTSQNQSSSSTHDTTSNKISDPVSLKQNSFSSIKMSLQTTTSSSTTTGIKRYAFAITITKDGFFQDGAAVLAYSIVRMFDKTTNMKFSFIAFVHPSVIKARTILNKLGFHVIVAPTPVNVSAISGPILRDKIDKNGCCGASELIKLNSYRLLQYDKVIHMDADTFFVNSILELLDEKYSLIYTTDPNMATHKGDRYMPVQDGFGVVMTVQGVLPYYYNAVSLPGRSKKVDRCIYNTMADTPECLLRTIDEIKSAHFTICQKPWPGKEGGRCQQSGYVNDLCRQLHERWFETRKLAEAFYGVKVNINPCKDRYTPIDFTDARFPKHSQFMLDDSPDFMKPILAARFLTENYDMSVGGHVSHRTTK